MKHFQVGEPREALTNDLRDTNSVEARARVLQNETLYIVQDVNRSAAVDYFHNGAPVEGFPRDAKLKYLVEMKNHENGNVHRVRMSSIRQAILSARMFVRGKINK